MVQITNKPIHQSQYTSWTKLPAAVLCASHHSVGFVSVLTVPLEQCHVRSKTHGGILWLHNMRTHKFAPLLQKNSRSLIFAHPKLNYYVQILFKLTVHHKSKLHMFPLPCSAICQYKWDWSTFISVRVDCCSENSPWHENMKLLTARSLKLPTPNSATHTKTTRDGQIALREKIHIFDFGVNWPFKFHEKEQEKYNGRRKYCSHQWCSTACSDKSSYQ